MRTPTINRALKTLRRNYDDSQPRDENGQWGDGGGSFGEGSGDTDGGGGHSGAGETADSKSKGTHKGTPADRTEIHQRTINDLGSESRRAAKKGDLGTAHALADARTAISGIARDKGQPSAKANPIKLPPMKKADKATYKKVLTKVVSDMTGDVGRSGKGSDGAVVSEKMAGRVKKLLDALK